MKVRLILLSLLPPTSIDLHQISSRPHVLLLLLILVGLLRLKGSLFMPRGGRWGCRGVCFFRGSKPFPAALPRLLLIGICIGVHRRPLGPSGGGGTGDELVAAADPEGP